ncbi:MAG: alpha/beta hydrolase, partial [Caulobacteraceae bacterium]
MLLPFFMALAAPLRSRVARGLAYGPAAGQTIEVHAPVGADGEAPVVVMFKPCDRRAGQILAAHGLVIVVAGLGADWGSQAALEDAAKACAWAREHAADYGGDPGRLFVFGHAEGGGVAARLALDPRWLEAVGLVDGLRGAVGVLGLYEVAGEDAPPVRPDAPPMLLFAAREDGGERDRSTFRLAQKLRAAGAEVAEIRVPWLDHTP